MSIFSSILDKLGFGKKKEEQPAEAAPAEAAPQPEAQESSAAAEAAAPAAGQVDVAAVCDALAAQNPQKLNWKASIVDLLKLLGIDSSLAARKSLAEELGCPAELIGGDYSQMNVWLHKAVLQKLAENGGKVPAELLG